jgi:hypothetical protein
LPEEDVKRWVFLVVWALAAGWVITAPASAQTDSFASQFYGVWYPFPLGNPTTGSIRYEFHHNAATGKDEMTVARTCPGEYRSPIAKVVVPIEIAEDNIRVLKGGSDAQAGEGNFVCRVSVVASVMSYTVSDNGTRVTITNPGGNPDILDLARQDVVSASLLPANFYGSWLLPPFDQKDARIEIRFVFYNSADSNKSNIRQVMSCSKGNRSLIAEAESAITVGKDEITILDSDSHEEREGSIVCKATLSAATLHYVLSPNGEIMTLSKPGDKPLVLTREH